MNKKKIRKNKLILAGKYAIPAIVIGIAVLVGTITITAVKANVSFWDQVAEWTGIKLAEKIDTPKVADDTFGAFPGPDVYNRMYFHEGFLGEGAIDIPLNQTAGTSTPDGLAVVLGSYCHSGDSIQITNWDWGIYTGNTLWGMSDFAIGTTTEAGHESFTATTTGTLVASSEVATSTTGIFDRDGYGDWQFTGLEHAAAGQVGTITTTIGSYYLDRLVGSEDSVPMATSTPFLLNDKDCVVASTASEGGATSTESFTTGGGNLFVAALHLEAIYK